MEQISKSFGGRPVLKKLSLKVFPGECVGILGPNGCGKTTLFSMCIGELSLDHGKIFLKDKSIHEMPIHLRADSLFISTGMTSRYLRYMVNTLSLIINRGQYQINIY